MLMMPSTEHQRRSPDCAFFAPIIPSEKPQKGRNKRQSKASSRLSIQSNNTRLSSASSANWEVFGEDSAMTTENSAMLPSQPAAIGSQASKPTRGSSMSKSRSNIKSKEDTTPNSFIEPEDDDFEVKVAEPPGKRSRGRKRKSDEIDQSCLDHQAGFPASGAPEPVAKRRTTRSRTSNIDTLGSTAVSAVYKDRDIQMTDDDTMPPPPAAKSGKGAKGGKKRASSRTRHASAASTASMASLRAAIPDDDALDAALEADLNRVLTDEEMGSPVMDPPINKRRLTRTRPGTKAELASTASVRNAAEASLVEDKSAAEPVDSDTKLNSMIAKPKKRVASRQKVPAPTPSAPTENTKVETSESRDEAARKKRGTKGKKVTRIEPEEKQEAERTMLADVKEDQQHSAENPPVRQKEETEPDPTVDISSCPMEDKSTGAKRSRTTKKPKLNTKEQQLPDDYPAAERSSTAAAIEEEDSVHEINVKVSDDESTLQRKKGMKKPVEKVKKGAKGKAKAAKASTPPPVLPSPSPEQPNKEVEDEAVEDQKSLPTPGVAVTPVKQASTQPFTSPPSDVENHPPSSRPASARPPLQTLSPSKFQPIRVPLALSTPVASPSKNISRLHTTQPWTAVDLDTFLLRSPEKGSATGAVGGLFTLPKARGDLSSPEKKMTVEQWIKANAENLEGKLRDDCERLVGRFEAEGMKALRTLEGVICRG